jgi:hypothetical protein
MFSNLFGISPSTLNLFSFILGMTFASFLSWYNRTAFIYIIGYFMGLAFFYGAISPNIESSPYNSRSTPVPQSDNYPPLPMPTPRGYK